MDLTTESGIKAGERMSPEELRLLAELAEREAERSTVADPSWMHDAIAKARAEADRLERDEQARARGRKLWEQRSSRARQ